MAFCAQESRFKMCSGIDWLIRMSLCCSVLQAFLLAGGQRKSWRVQILQTSKVCKCYGPGKLKGLPPAFSTFLPLSNTDFEGPETVGPMARLRGNGIDFIVDTVESLRARAIGARQAFLIREFVIEARRVGLSIGGMEGGLGSIPTCWKSG
jgi:hypothetical protein